MTCEKITHGRLKGCHKARYVVINGIRTRIDANIAELIIGLMRVGIKTVNSCGAGCGGWCRRKHVCVGKCGTFFKRRMTKLCRESVWLIFETPDDASRFLNIVYRESDPEKLRDHMRGSGRRQSHAWNWGDSCRTC